ncbi:transketolase [Pseudomonas baetica]|uniref:transketolase n=1 Tax=Pseudomonas baetica TaxID=674054 RepID=UPI003EEAD8CC
MHAISQSAIWVKAPSANAGVVIVTSAALPQYMIDQLRLAIDDWDQVGYLVVRQSTALMLDWLRVGSSTIESTQVDTCDARQLLSGVSKGCFLLDVEIDPIPGLAWLGSVCGHTLRVLEVGQVESSSAAMDRQVESILSVTRALAKNVLQERCVI